MLAVSDPLSALIGSAGTAGIVVVLLIMGYMHTRPAMDRERLVADAELARRQAMIDTLLAVYHHEVLPTLGDIEKRMIPMMEKTEQVLTEVQWLFAQLERRRSESSDITPRIRSDETRNSGGRGQDRSTDLDPPDTGRP